MTEAPAPPGSRARWRNWAGNERADAEVVQPESVDEVAAVLTSAAAAGRRVRPIGSGHSFTGIGRPEDLQLTCGGLAGIGEVSDDGLVTVGAGIPLFRLNAELVRRGLVAHQPRGHRPSDDRRRPLDRHPRHRRAVRRAGHAGPRSAGRDAVR